MKQLGFWMLLVGGFLLGVAGQTTTLLRDNNRGDNNDASSIVSTDNTNDHDDSSHRSLQVDGGKKLKQNFQVAKAKMIQKLQNDYGAALFESTFMTNWKGGTERVTQGRRFFLSPSVPKSEMETNENDGPSWDRLVRRMAIKILQAQLAGSSNNDNKIPFIWSTGGHSSAAGHGNYYNESYTYNMEKTVKGVFESVGVDFIGRYVQNTNT
jgi:hypothetical protein